MLDLNHVLHSAGHGFRRMFTFFFGLLGVLVAATLVSYIVVFPLWLAATREPAFYTAAILSVLVAVALLAAARSIRRNGSARLVTAVRRIVTIVVTLAAIYLILVLIASGQLLIGIPLAAAFVVGLGVIAGWNYSGAGKRSASNESTN